MFRSKIKPFQFTTPYKAPSCHPTLTRSRPRIISILNVSFPRLINDRGGNCGLKCCSRSVKQGTQAPNRGRRAFITCISGHAIKDQRGSLYRCHKLLGLLPRSLFPSVQSRVPESNGKKARQVRLWLSDVTAEMQLDGCDITVSCFLAWVPPGYRALVVPETSNLFLRRDYRRKEISRRAKDRASWPCVDHGSDTIPCERDTAWYSKDEGLSTFFAARLISLSWNVSTYFGGWVTSGRDKWKVIAARTDKNLTTVARTIR